MTPTTLQQIQDWYKSECNGDWEHSFGLQIDTLDNPGWSVRIDLTNTNLQDLEFSKNVDNGENDWYSTINTRKSISRIWRPYQTRTDIENFSI